MEPRSTILDLEDFDALCPASFWAEIDILPRGPDAPPKWNGIRWSFVFAEDLDAHPNPPAVHSNTWPLFRNPDGSMIPPGVALEGRLPASLHIVQPKAATWFRDKGLAVGSRFYCCEANRAYAEGRVTEILNPDLL